MQYIIFGCGMTGRKALPFLGWTRVFCFASNHPLDEEGHEREVDGKKVVSFDEMLRMAASGEYLIVVATEKYARLLGEQLLGAGVRRFFVFHESDESGIWGVYPGYWLYRKWETVTYNRALSLYGISKYKKIAVYGDNDYLPYLISEIAFQNDFDTIIGVVPHSYSPRIRSVGLPVRTLDEIWDEIDCLVVNVRRNEDPIHDILDGREHGFDVVDLYDVGKFEPAFHHPELAKYKDIHKGKRIFLVGNGPSVRIEDLEKLHEHGEISFGFNQIYRVFEQTKWRPTYLGICDHKAVIDSWDMIPKMKGDIFITDLDHLLIEKMRFQNVMYVHCEYQGPYPNRPNFSADITRGTYDGGTVLYVIGLEFAAYMGASEVYLIGADHSYSTNSKKYSVDEDHFIKGYVKNPQIKDEIGKLDYDFSLRFMTKIRTCTRCLCLLRFIKLISIFQAFWPIEGDFNDSLYFFQRL